MAALILQGEPPIEVLLRVSARARRMTLRVSALDGRVTLSMPPWVGERDAVRFVEEKQDWIRRQLQGQHEPECVSFDSMVPVLGRMYRIVPGQGRRVVLKEGQIEVPGPDASVGARVSGHLKTMARARLAEASDQYALRLGKSYAGLSIRDTRSRWGSCSSQAKLMYSWRLIMAPDHVLHYVAAHEVAHLKEMNHSKAFWSVVEDLFGDCTEPRRWLRTEGPALHRYKFGN